MEPDMDSSSTLVLDIIMTPWQPGPQTPTWSEMVDQIPGIHTALSYNRNYRHQSDHGFCSAKDPDIALRSSPGTEDSVEEAEENNLKNNFMKMIEAFKEELKNFLQEVEEKTLQGLGYAKTPDISARQLQWKDEEGHSGIMQPYVLELPISLWGRDLMTDMGFRLSNDYSLASRNMMMGIFYNSVLELSPTFSQGSSITVYWSCPQHSK
ncbi:hypothetical protein STEG23_007277, partial [Scotinomys teguina]